MLMNQGVLLLLVLRGENYISILSIYISCLECNANHVHNCELNAILPR